MVAKKGMVGAFNLDTRHALSTLTPDDFVGDCKPHSYILFNHKEILVEPFSLLTYRRFIVFG
jgi:hypothetical protein